MGRRYDKLEDLVKRRDMWAKEIGTRSIFADVADYIVGQLDAEIAALRARSQRGG